MQFRTPSDSGFCRLLFPLCLSGILFFIPFQKISENFFFCCSAGFSRILYLIVSSQIITFLPEHDLSDPLVSPTAVIDATHAAGICSVHKVRTKHLDTCAPRIMHIFLRVALTSAASRPSALQIGLPHIHRISAVTSAVPYTVLHRIHNVTAAISFNRLLYRVLRQIQAVIVIGKRNSISNSVLLKFNIDIVVTKKAVNSSVSAAPKRSMRAA